MSSAKPVPSNTPSKKRVISWKLLLASVIAIAIIGYLIWDVVATGPLMRFLTNRDELIVAVKSWGIFAPLIYIILQVAQTVIAPIPGQIVGSIGGFIFGAWGVLWTAIGTLLGCYIVFKLARRFGRPLLERLFKPATVKEFDFIINHRSAGFVLFLIFLLPGFPDDVICYIAGLTNLSIRRLMTIVILGRLPLIILTNYIGAGVTTNLTAVVVVSIVAVLILGIFLWQRKRILSFLKRK